MKSYGYPILIVLVIAIIGGVAYWKGNTKSYEQVPVVETPSEQLATSSPDTASQSPSAPVANTYTMAQIATHNSSASCWTTINGNVYDVSAWISKHPGGAGAILSLCGKDGSAAFDGKHGGQARPEAELASFKIGTLGS